MYTRKNELRKNDFRVNQMRSTRALEVSTNTVCVSTFARDFFAFLRMIRKTLRINRNHC